MTNASVFEMFNGLSALWAIAAFIVAIGILVTVHEFGHFWIARRCGVKVTCFSIGFGKKLWSRTDKQGTEFIIALIPLGGYVKMLDERIENVPEQLKQFSFNRKTIAQRAAIVSAGPIANFLFAIVIFWAVYMLGVPIVSPIVGSVTPNSIAAQVNIPENSEIKSVAGINTDNWSDVRLAILGEIGKNSLHMTYQPADTQHTESTTLNIKDWRIDLEKQDPITELGLVPKPITFTSQLQQVIAGSAAYKAGLREGDKVLSYNQTPFTVWNDFAATIRKSAGQTLNIQVERSSRVIDISLLVDSRKLADGSEEGFAGIVPMTKGIIIQQSGLFKAFNQGVSHTLLLTKITVNSFWQLITGVFSIKNLAGPVSIAKGAGQSASYGLIPYLTFLGFISVSLAVINLFPLPVLDGGHLMFLLIEKIKGRPVSETVMEMCFRVGSIFIILLMGFSLFNDFSRL